MALMTIRMQRKKGILVSLNASVAGKVQAQLRVERLSLVTISMSRKDPPQNVLLKSPPIELWVEKVGS